MSKTVWILTCTEYEDQCTGFSQATNLIAIFDQKPSLEVVAPMVTEWLPKDDMGRAISLITTLLNEGHFEAQIWGNKAPDIELQEIFLNVDLS